MRRPHQVRIESVVPFIVAPLFDRGKKSMLEYAQDHTGSTTTGVVLCTTVCTTSSGASQLIGAGFLASIKQEP